MSLERHNMKSKVTLYYNDLFHTIVNVRVSVISAEVIAA